MKKKAIAGVLMLLFAVSACLNSFGDDKEKYGFYVPRNNEEIHGTWVNTTYAGSKEYAQKLVMYDWGYWEMYSKVTDELGHVGTFILVNKWTDPEGNIWYKEYVRERMNPFPRFELDKISKNGTVWEYLSVWDDFPIADNMNPQNPYYRIYYREQEF